MRRRLALVPVAALSACVYFNAWYDANRDFDEGLDRLGENNSAAARVSFDSVIAITGRIVENHPDSKYADDAAILKARSELHRELWESAAESARTARALTSDAEIEHLASGLEGVARRELGEFAVADSLLSKSLSGRLEADDRALFLLNRGLARLEADRAREAVEDLTAAGELVDLSAQGRLNLAVGLRDVGQYGESAALSTRLLATEPVNMRSPLYLHVDSLSRLAPQEVVESVTMLADDPDTPPTQRAAYQLVVGRSWLHAGQPQAALESLDAAIASAPTSSIAADASHHAMKLRLAGATSPADVTRSLEYSRMAGRATQADLRTEAEYLGQSARLFSGLVEAYESRGASAAEAAFRAAEIAGTHLGAPALARGLYLLYLESDPDSPWAAKAMLGALRASGHPPSPSWVEDRGAATDAELREALSALPVTDPYRRSLAEGMGAVADDSTFLYAERELSRRLDEIQVLLGPDVTPVIAPRSIAVDADSAEARPDTGRSRIRRIE